MALSEGMLDWIPRLCQKTRKAKTEVESMKKFKVITTSTLDDWVELEDISARDEEDAWRQIDESMGNLDSPTLLNATQWKRLKKLMDAY